MIGWAEANIAAAPRRARAIALPRHSRFAIDLAEDIGSLQWWRGLAVMLALIATAMAFWPGFTINAALPMRLDAAAAMQLRSRATAPLIAGGAPRPFAPTAMAMPIAFAPERARLDLVAISGEGDSFAPMLQRAGVGAGDAARVGALVAAAVAPGSIAPGTRFDLTLGRRPAPGQPRALDRIGFRARFDLALVVTRQGGGFTLTRQPISVDTTPLRIRFPVGTGLYRAARAAGAPVKAIAQYLQTLAAHLSLDDIAPGAIADLIVGYKRAHGGQSEVGDLLYAGLDRDGRPGTQLLRWGSDGQFFDAAADPAAAPAAAGWMAPVIGRITSSFGMRFHPILGYTRMHEGVDFGAPYGAPIHAVAAGTVIYAGVHGGHGNYVRLDHGSGLGTGYAHMSRFAVAPGARVSAGEIIGYVGATGLATGPHLHYEVYENGRPVDPLSVHFASHAAVDPRDAAAFKARLAELLLVRPGAALGKM